MASERSYIKWFDEPEADDLASVGGKGANLARLVGAGFPVPPGFCITAGAYHDFIRAGDLYGRIMVRLVDATDLSDIESAGAAVRREIRERSVPEAIADPIRAAYARLGDGRARVAVRSSATAEDLPEASFAGQQDTYLNVCGEAALLEHVRRCWASLWTDRAIAYRQAHGYAHEGVLLAVVVQEMIPSETAGVMFTANPVSGRRDETVINASFGLGEAVVSGLVTPDTYVVRPRAGAILQRNIAQKALEIVYDPDGLVMERSIGAPRAEAPSLADDEVVALAALGERVQGYYGTPQDIEWGRVHGRFYLLQSRPITTLDEAPELDPRDHWTRAMFVEVLPDAPSPQFASVMAPILSDMLAFTFRAWGLRPPRDIPAVKVFYSQPYFNLRYIRAALSGLPEATRERLTARIANPFTEHEDAGGDGGGRSLRRLALAWRMLGAVHRLPRQLPGVIDDYYATLERYRRQDPAAMSDAELIRDTRVVALGVLPPLIHYDFLLIAALGFSERILASMVARSGLPDAHAIQAALMSGLTGNLTMRTNRRLWQLAQTARAHPAVANAIGDGPDETLHERIRAADGGAVFLAELDAFLREFGHREVRMDIAWPTWGEDPTPVLQFVRSYLDAEGAPDPAVQEQTLADRHRQAARAVEAALGRTMKGRTLLRPIFRWALAHAEALGSERDSMHFHWTASFPVIRGMMGDLGLRWSTADLLDQADDIYCFTLDEIDDFVSEPRRLQSDVARRRQAWERDNSHPGPIELREVEAPFHDEDVAAPEAAGVGLRGIAGSPGKVSGVVRVIHGPGEFSRLKQGEILVAPVTNPVWTPLFAVAAALVTDSGGILSHGAIVAREYGIPAVMGVRGATRTLHDGQHVTVDGVRGTIVIDDVVQCATTPRMPEGEGVDAHGCQAAH